jgi:hypothetical protein
VYLGKDYAREEAESYGGVTKFNCARLTDIICGSNQTHVYAEKQNDQGHQGDDHCARREEGPFKSIEQNSSRMDSMPECADHWLQPPVRFHFTAKPVNRSRYSCYQRPDPALFGGGTL